MNALRALFCSIVVGLTACAEPPPCRIEPAAAEDARLNGICLVVTADRVLAVHHRASGKYDLPGGRRRPGETAQCTAHRETWEETGFDVMVGQRAATFTNAALYRCRLDPQPGTELPAGRPALLEVTAVEWVDATTLEPRDWRFEDRSDAIRAALRE